MPSSTKTSDPVPRYFFRISFQGTRYHGWQIQENAHTVQEEFNSKLGMILQQEINSIGCGRTDTGVHALDFVVHADLEKGISDPDKLKYNLNNVLPPDIAVKELWEVGPEMHARFSARKRSYIYKIIHEKDPFMEDWALQHTRFTDPVAMNACAKLLIGKRSFKCFCKGPAHADNYDCEIYAADWQFDKGRTQFCVSANRFLRNMVRAMVGTMLEVGMGKLSVDEFKAILESGDRSDAGASVAGKGLYLSEVRY